VLFDCINSRDIDMHGFVERIRKHAEHVATAGTHCTTEETTKQALILPMLDILGFSPFDPTKVRAEHGADFPGAKAGERVDYALFCHGVPVMFIEAKPYIAKLGNHSPQLSRYFNATPEVAVAAITNGREWRFFTDLHNKNIMDAEPFLTVDFAALDESLLPRLNRFRHDEFQPEALRTLAEESIYLSAFKAAISSSLRNPDPEFVRYVAGRANVQRQFNARFIESITPLVKQAVERALSEMLVSSLAEPVSEAMTASLVTEKGLDPEADIIDPTNSKVVTTYAERRLLELIVEILGPAVDVQGKDTESYYTVLYQGKSNRWIARFQSDRRIPLLTLPIALNEERRREVARAGLQIGPGESVQIGSPENILRITGLVFDALSYCMDDSNFRRATTNG